VNESAPKESVVQARLAIKVDVCNRRALEQGVPPLLETLRAAGVRASFFVAFGPDHSGRALLRIFQRGFLMKMLRTRAPQMYGWKTLLHGTLLPGPPVGEAFPERLRAIEAAGHELGVHGWDHVGWQNRAARMPAEQLRASYQRAWSAFERALGHAPAATAAPGWQCSATSFAIAAQLGFAYASDCRGDAPFYPADAASDGGRVLQIPTTLPTSDELVGSGEVEVAELAAYYLGQLQAGSLHVLCIHAEAEGLIYARWFAEFLAAARKRAVQFLTFGEIAREFRASAPSREVQMRALPGRAGPVACAAER
jgi:peptidoglycan/xylan/chitin deacetylase (PgdA/CDA1 family)